MGWKGLMCVCMAAALTGCGQAAAAVHWTVDVDDAQVSLRDGEKGGTVELVLRKDGTDTVLRTLTQDTEYSQAEDLSAWAFTDILDRDGFVLRTTQLGGAWGRNVYYSVEDGAAVPMAESFGFGEPQDYPVDLDGDGVRELVVNVTYGGDGHQEAYVYQRGDDGIRRGIVSLADVPDFDDWGANARRTVYDPARNVFVTHYAVKGREDYALLETTGLERMEFDPYKEAM